MKTTTQWSEIWFDYETREQLCQAIQDDALMHAADIAESYDNESHHGNDTMTKQNIASEIRAAAMPNAPHEPRRE